MMVHRNILPVNDNVKYFMAKLDLKLKTIKKYLMYSLKSNGID
jgi:hypothetical protein